MNPLVILLLVVIGLVLVAAAIRQLGIPADDVPINVKMMDVPYDSHR